MTIKSLRKSRKKTPTPAIGAEESTNSTETTSKMSLRALNDIYIVLEDPVETVYDTGVSSEVTDAIKEGKLIIPDKWKDFSSKYPCRGMVIAKGDKCKLPIALGDKVIYARLGVQRYMIDGKTLCDVREGDLHAIVESS